VCGVVGGVDESVGGGVDGVVGVGVSVIVGVGVFVLGGVTVLVGVGVSVGVGVAVSVGVGVNVLVGVGVFVLVGVGVTVGGISAPLWIWLSRLPTDAPSNCSHLKWYGPPLMLPDPTSAPQLLCRLPPTPRDVCPPRRSIAFPLGLVTWKVTSQVA